MLSGLNSSVSALLGLSKKTMSIANNVANVNTPGYKASHVRLQDSSSQTVSTGSGPSQIGSGVQAGAIVRLSGQGSFENTANSTDMGISGQGFFVLKQPGSQEADQYSRTGNFKLNAQGGLVNPAGLLVQGWKVDSANGESYGSLGDINIDKTTSPSPTKQITQIVNFDSRTPNEDVDINLFDAWDGRNAATTNSSPLLDSASYDYQNRIAVYDQQGGSHDVNIYFDRTTNENEWEFLVTTDPLEDHRVIDSQQASYAPYERYTASEHKGAGALLYGTINFNSNGEIKDITAYNVPPDGQVNPTLNDNRFVVGSTNSYFSFPVNYSSDQKNSNIELNFGAKYSGVNNEFIAEPMASTQYANSSITSYQSQDGFGSGFLQSVSVGTDGIISGRYSNGQVLKKGQVALASFSNPGDLTQIGGNLFSANTSSGSPVTSTPKSNGLGSIIPNGLEMSNVELGYEIPNLMLNQRYFQANIKTIQTQDEMLGSLLNIKS